MIPPRNSYWTKSLHPASILAPERIQRVDQVTDREAAVTVTNEQRLSCADSSALWPQTPPR